MVVIFETGSLRDLRRRVLATALTLPNVVAMHQLFRRCQVFMTADGEEVHIPSAALHEGPKAILVNAGLVASDAIGDLTVSANAVRAVAEWEAKHPVLLSAA